MVRNGIRIICFYFCIMERNSELFCFPLKDSEGNSKSLLLLLQGMEFRVASLPLKGLEGNFESLLLFFVPQNGILSYFLFRERVRNGIPKIFCSAEQPEFHRK